MNTAQQTSVITRGGLTGFRVAGSLLQRNVLDHYVASLVRLRREGFLPLVRSTYEPYTRQFWDNFAAERKSWTESLLDPSGIGKLLRWPWGGK